MHKKMVETLHVVGVMPAFGQPAIGDQTFRRFRKKGNGYMKQKGEFRSQRWVVRIVG